MYNEPTLSVCGVFLVALNYNGVASDVTQISAVEERLIICCVYMKIFTREMYNIYSLCQNFKFPLIYDSYIHACAHACVHVSCICICV